MAKIVPKPGYYIRMRDGAIGDKEDQQIDLSGADGTILDVWEDQGGSWSASVWLHQKGGWLILDHEVDLVLKHHPKRKLVLS